MLIGFFIQIGECNLCKKLITKTRVMNNFWSKTKVKHYKKIIFALSFYLKFFLVFFIEFLNIVSLATRNFRD